jgi:hypothetical protein
VPTQTITGDGRHTEGTRGQATTRTAVATFAALVAAAALTACSGAAEQPEAAETSQSPATSEPVPETSEPEPSPEPTTAAPAEVEKGTRDNPYSPGEPFAIGDWEVTLGETDPDATPEVIAEQMELYGGDESYTTPPDPGHLYITVPVTATYNGAESDDPGFALSYAYVAADGNTYANIIPVGAPDDLTMKGELYPGGTATGNVLQMVEAADVSGGAWRITETFWESTAGEVFVAGAP